MQTHFHSPRHKTCSEKLIHSTSRTQLNTLKTEHREHTLISSSTLPPMHAPSSGQICVNQKHEPGLGYNLLISNKMGKFAMFDSRHLNQSRGQASLAGSRSGHSRPMLTMFLNTLTRIYGWHPNYGSSQRTREIPLLSLPCKIMLLMGNQEPRLLKWTTFADSHGLKLSQWDLCLLFTRVWGLSRH